MADSKKVALITGGTGGVGQGLAKRLAQDGIKIVIGYAHSIESAEKVVREIRELGGEASAISSDLGEPKGAEFLFQKALEQYGKVDYLINNAGVNIPVALSDLTAEMYKAIFDINVQGALFMLQQAARHLQDQGRIVNISSQLVASPIAGSALYAASKAALEMFSKVLSREVGARGITVNAIRLGATIPGMFSKAPPERQKFFQEASPFKRLGTPEDLAHIISFLLTPQSQWITGQTITVDGGAL